MSLRRGLTRYGFEVVWVATGGEALQASTPDLVLLDLGLPLHGRAGRLPLVRARTSVPIIDG